MIESKLVLSCAERCVCLDVAVSVVIRKAKKSLPITFGGKFSERKGEKSVHRIRKNKFARVEKIKDKRTSKSGANIGSRRNNKEKRRAFASKQEQSLRELLLIQN